MGVGSSSVGAQPPSKRPNNGWGSSGTCPDVVAMLECEILGTCDLVLLVQVILVPSLAYDLRVLLSSSPLDASQASIVPPSIPSTSEVENQSIPLVSLVDAGTKGPLRPPTVSPIVGI
jgi:hypothetical protein